jgi:broad specificity phosphatase PhoE
VSPLERCISTANYTFSGLSLPSSRPFAPVIKELLREDLGVHTCDRRSNKSEIAKRWPQFKIEDGFTEEDELWDPEYRESESAHIYRLKLLLDDIFSHNDATFISLTSHSGSITSILKGVGHRKFSLQTGGLIPLLLRVRKMHGSRPHEQLEPPTRPPICEPSKV